MNPGARALIRLARPRQWTKNAAVGAAFLFALGDPARGADGRMALAALGAMCVFCLLSSGVYAINDARDAASDRRHPAKRLRPVAAGQIPPRRAVAWGAAWLLLGLACAWALGFAPAAAAYVALQLAHTLALKQVGLLDVFVIAVGFVLRAVAGASAIRVPISPWLLLCALLLALFLALCKRKSEFVRESKDGETAPGGRRALRPYDGPLLDQLIGITASATVVCYALYTQWPDTVLKFGTHGLGFTIPVVMFGLFRYLGLVYREGRGESPEQELLTDRPLLAALVLFVLLLMAVFAAARGGPGPAAPGPQILIRVKTMTSSAMVSTIPRVMR